MEEKSELSLIAITKISEKMIKEFASIIPGEPAVHLTAFMQTISHRNRKRSPGNDKDCCNPKIEKSHLNISKSMFMNGIEVILSMEKAIIADATI